LSTSIF